MISGGYILQPRCFDKSDTSNFPPVTREIWMYILRKVNHKEKGKYKRGQGFFNFGDIQKDLSWFVGYRRETYSKPQITKSLRRLCDASMVETVKATRGILITVLNYSFYQDPKNYEGNNEEPTKEMGCEEGGHTKNKNERMKECKETTLVDGTPSTCPHQKIIELYNTILPALPQVKKNLWNGQRQKNLQSRWKEDKERQTVDWWKLLFDSISQMPFLLGDNKTGWKADMGWILNASNFIKILEGKYLPKQAGSDWI